jgi:hypothetical protein
MKHETSRQKALQRKARERKLKANSERDQDKKIFKALIDIAQRYPELMEQALAEHRLEHYLDECDTTFLKRSNLKSR